MAGEFQLSERERATLAAVCDAFHPPLTAEPGDDPILFSTSASALGVPDAAEQAIALLAPAQRTELRQLLWLLDNGLFAWLVGGTKNGVSRMSRDESERFLLSLATSSIPQLRSGFQALKRLSSFLYCSVADENGDNPVWPRIHYKPSTLPPARAERLDVTTYSEETRLDADACVIGSGAGGGVAAAILASRGWRVVVLEAGPADQAGDFSQREREAFQRLYLDSGLLATRDVAVPILAGACLGGGTAINWQTSLELPARIRDEWAEQSGCAVFTSDRFSRALAAVMRRLSVSTNESVVNENNARLRRGCEALGYKTSPVARNSVGCEPNQCGYCTFGCRIGGKQSTTVTYLRDAQTHGDTTIVANCRADQITVAGGRVIGAIAYSTTANGSRVRVTVRAPRVVIAAGAIQSPGLLLRSRLTLPHLGRHLHLHPTTGAVGYYPETVEPWCGPPQSILSDQLATIDGNYGILLEAAPTHPGLLALALPWTSAVDHRRLVQKSAKGAALIAVTRDSTGGRVRVRRDGTAVVDYTIGPRERTLVARGMAETARVHFGAGADHVLSLHTRPLVLKRTPTTTTREISDFCERMLGMPVGGNLSGVFSAHQMGTCRMGRSARTAVCDERGQVFGVNGLYIADASAFPASSGVNPMITVMALAKCIADGIE